jgi:hypothetical protein
MLRRSEADAKHDGVNGRCNSAQQEGQRGTSLPLVLIERTGTLLDRNLLIDLVDVDPLALPVELEAQVDH